MRFRQELKKSRFQLQVGFCFLIFASAAKWLCEPGNNPADQWIDGTVGLLYGISIGFMLLGIWRRRRQNRI